MSLLFLISKVFLQLRLFSMILELPICTLLPYWFEFCVVNSHSHILRDPRESYPVPDPRASYPLLVSWASYPAEFFFVVLPFAVSCFRALRLGSKAPRTRGSLVAT